jgi:NADPH:quinone reductase-like Zn-dependent oxidoreductase
MAMFELPRPLNGLAEYISCKEKLVEMAPKSVPLAFASALPSSAMSAMIAAQKHVRNGDRVMVLGGCGGVGTFFVQLAKAMGAAYVAVTSTTDKEWLMPSLGVDKVINYEEDNWWEDKELLTGGPFDLIVDLAVGYEAWAKAKQSKLLDRHGTFLAFTSDKALIEIHNMRQTITAIGPMQCRTLWTKLWPCSPRYIWHDGLEVKPGRLAEVARLVDDGIMRIVLDPVSPLPFSEESVKRGFHIMKKRHAHGKVVVSILD